MKARERLAMIIAGIRGRKLTDKEVIKYNCNIIMELHGPDGELKERREVHNLIVTAGKDLLLAASGAKKVSDFNRLAIGTNNTAASASDTALGTQVYRTTALTPTNPDSHTLQFQTTIAAGDGTGAIVEVGMFDANSSGNMLNRSVFAVINKGASDALTMTVQFT